MILKREKRIGETRYALINRKRILEIHIERWNEVGRPRAGDRFMGRVTSIEKALAAAFIDLGHGPKGFLNFTLAGQAPRLTEGQMIEVEILREAEAEKGPLLRFVALSNADKIGALEQHSLEEKLAAQYGELKIVDAVIDEFDAYTEYSYVLAEGGELNIAPTRAATTIDVDVAQGKNKREVALAAAKTVARMVSARNIGGLVLVDFPNLRKKRDRNDVWELLSAELDDDLATTKIDPMSRFGTVLFSRQKTGRSLTQILHDERGDATAETQALDGLNRLVREGRANPGAQLTLTVPETALDWLKAGYIDWNTPLTDAIGARYRLESGQSIDVKRDRSS